MTKPWDNEPAPISNLADHNRNYPDGFIPSNTGRYLERRLRHAERLLEDVLGDATIFYEEKTLSKIATHLEAARQEDGR